MAKMGTFRIKILGVRQAVMKFLRIGVEAEVGLRVIQARSAERIKSRAQGLVPVSSGHLQAGIEAKYVGGGWTVTASSIAGGADKEYAAFVEYGTYKMAAQPYMRPATEGEGAAIIRDLGALAVRLERV